MQRPVQVHNSKKSYVPCKMEDSSAPTQRYDFEDQVPYGTLTTNSCSRKPQLVNTSGRWGLYEVLEDLLL